MGRLRVYVHHLQFKPSDLVARRNVGQILLSSGSTLGFLLPGQAWLPFQQENLLIVELNVEGNLAQAQQGKDKQHS